MTPLNTCVPGGGGYYAVFTTGTFNATAQTITEYGYTSSDCSGTAVGFFSNSYLTACSQISLTPPAGFLKMVSLNASCTTPTMQRGYLPGICYRNFEPFSVFQSFLFQSCGAGATYTLLAYNASNSCTGASAAVTSPYPLTCDYDLSTGESYLSQCIVNSTAGPNQTRVPAPVSAI